MKAAGAETRDGTEREQKTGEWIERAERNCEEGCMRTKKDDFGGDAESDLFSRSFTFPQVSVPLPGRS